MKHILLLFTFIYLLSSCTYKNEEDEYYSKSDSLDIGLIAHFTFDNSLLDKSENSTVGTLNGEAAYSDGKFSKALILNGRDNYFTIPAGSQQKISLVFYFLGDGELSSTQKPNIINYGQDALKLNLDAISGGTYFTVNGETLNTPEENWINSYNGWNFLYVEVSIAAKTVKIICNSEKKAYTEPLNTILENAMTLQDGNIIIGCGPDKSAESYFKGMIDDIRIYSRTLTQEEIQKLMNL